MRPHVLSLAGCLLCAIVLAGCGAAGPSVTPSATQASVATAVPSPAPALTHTTTAEPTPARIGASGFPPTHIAVVDDVLREVDAGDTTSLIARVRLASVPCAANPMGIGAPPICPP